MKRPVAKEYPSFEQLAAERQEGVDFAVDLVDRQSPVAVVAPHGGHIEPETAELVLAIAGGDFSSYAFKALKPHAPPHPLHITSHNFNEPRCLRLLETREVVVTVHGRADNGDEVGIYLGGLNKKLVELAAQAFLQNEFSVKREGHKFLAENPNNICNRGKTGAGLQLELPRSLRTKMRLDAATRATFVAAIRSALIEAASKFRLDRD